MEPSQTPQWLQVITLLALLLLVAPGMLRMNRGKILPRIAMWCGLFLLLIWVYQTFGPF